MAPNLDIYKYSKNNFLNKILVFLPDMSKMCQKNLAVRYWKTISKLRKYQFI